MLPGQRLELVVNVSREIQRDDFAFSVVIALGHCSLP
jgi:hypothetical protein